MDESTKTQIEASTRLMESYLIDGDIKSAERTYKEILPLMSEHELNMAWVNIWRRNKLGIFSEHKEPMAAVGYAVQPVKTDVV